MSSISVQQNPLKVHHQVNSYRNPHSDGHRAEGTRNLSLGIQEDVSSTTPISTDKQPKQPNADPDEARQKRRIKRLRIGQSLRYGWTLSRQKEAMEQGEKFKKEKFLRCQRDLIPRGDGVVSGYRSGGRGSFGGLQHCDDPLCPYCAPKVAEQNCREITVLLSQALSMGYSLIYVVETVSHDRFETCADVRDHVQRLHEAAFSGRWWDDTRGEWGITDYITIWESTFGRNGHHPHRNTVYLSSVTELTPPMVSHLADQMKERYQACARKLGLNASYEYGIEIKTGDAAIAEYLSKFGHTPVDKVWSLEDEMTRGHGKKSREGFMPCELLDVCNGDKAALERFSFLMLEQDEVKLKKIAARAFCELWDAFGGKKQYFHMSKGLKRRLDFETAMRFYEDVVSPRLESEKAWEMDYSEYCEKVMGKTPAADLRGELLWLTGKATRADLVAWFEAKGVKAVVLLPEETPPVIVIEDAALPVQSPLPGNLIRANDLKRFGY